MKRSFIFTLPILIIFTFGISSCEKEYSFEGTGSGSESGTASYTFNGFPGECESIVNGEYKKGVGLSSSNTVIIDVNVLLEGPYSIKTATINNISFSASGTFSAKGANTITLNGSGTPEAAGPFQFVPGSNGCVIFIDVVD